MITRELVSKAYNMREYELSESKQNLHYLSYKKEYIKPYKPLKIDKKWGYELVIRNEAYCGKILFFEKGKRCSGHLHLLKTETWYCLCGKFSLLIIDPKTAQESIFEFKKGDCFHLPNGLPHQIICLETGCIMEVSTKDYNDDNIRYKPGDSQL